MPKDYWTLFIAALATPGALSAIQRISALAEIFVLTHTNIHRYVCNICPKRNVYKYSHRHLAFTGEAD